MEQRHVVIAAVLNSLLCLAAFGQRMGPSPRPPPGTLIDSEGAIDVVVIYEQKNFKGRSQAVTSAGLHPSDWKPTSIKVPAGLVAFLSESADSPGGYGTSVDLLEDHSDLTEFGFTRSVSIAVRPSTSDGFFWARQSMVNGQFIEGHWEKNRAGGNPINTTAVASPRGPESSGPDVREHGYRSATPAAALTMTYKNPPFDTSKQSWPHWAKEAVRGKAMFPDKWDVIPGTRIFSSPDYSPNEWTQLLGKDEDYEVDVVGVSGRAIIVPDGKSVGRSAGSLPAVGGEGVSGGDVPFTHPFGTDWEFYIAPDAAYQNLAAPPAPQPWTHPEYAQSVTLAKDEFGLVVVNTLGVEMEQGLIPLAYRVQHGDRVAVWGRWIVDTGHPDFHTEIHPPLLLATARATSSDETTMTVIGRPYLVSQRWPGGEDNVASLGMIDHLLEEADKIPLRSLRAEAHPRIMPKAFTGVYAMTYTVRPPSARKSPSDRLMVTFHFTVRTGVAVQVVNAGDAVSVYVVMNGNVNKRAELPKKHDLVVDRKALKAMDPRAGDLYIEKEVESGITSVGIGAMLLARGVLTDRYDPPFAHSVHDSEMTQVPVSSLSGNTPFSVDDGQPFPIYGRLTLKWKKGGN